MPSPATPAALASLLLASLVAGCLGGPAPADAGAPLAPATGQLREFELWFTVGEIEVMPGKTVFALGFTDDPGKPIQVPGPELRVREGDTVRVLFHGTHGHTIHWHGLSVPWAMDGVPFLTQPIGDGGDDYTYEFVAKESGTYWYHCHVDAPVHVDFGMFGAIIVEPRDPAHDPPYDREATLFLHDYDEASQHVVDATYEVLETSPEGIHVAPPGNPADLPDYLEANLRGEVELVDANVQGATGVGLGASAGPRDYYPWGSTVYRPMYDLFLINGKSFPATEPVFLRSGETLRLRLVNAGQLVHTMHLHGHHGLVTHKDGYKLQAPFHADTIGLFPGERYDVYVRGDNPGAWDLHDHGGSWDRGAYAANGHAFPGGMQTMLVYEDFPLAEGVAHGPGGPTSGAYRALAPSFRGVAPAHGH